MAKKIKVMYVGKKANAFDNVARSGKTWAGNGDIQEVTDIQARELVKYADQWVLVDEKDQKKVQEPTSLKVEDENGEEVSVDPATLDVSFELMSKVELVAFARFKYDKLLDIQKSKKELIDEVEAMVAGLDTVE